MSTCPCAVRKTADGAAQILMVLALSVALAPRAESAPNDERQLDALRARRQFELAEKYCSDRLADAQLSDAARAEMTIELSRTLAEHAAHSATEAQATLWKQARQVVDDFERDYPRHPKLLLVRMQAALAATAQGELARENADLAGGNRAALDEAREALRGAIARLRKLDDALAAETQRRGRAAGLKDDARLSAAQLASLAMHVRYQLARGLRNQGLCYPAGTADRINALTQAVELLPAITRQDLETPLAWSSRLDEIACLRWLEDYPASEKLLAKWENGEPPANAMPRLRAERIRLALARGQIDEALSESGPGGFKTDAGWAEANCAQLEVYLAAWQRAQQRSDVKEAVRWERAAVDQVRTIEQSHGPAWMRRAEALLARSMAHSTGTDSADALVRAAQSFYRSGQLDEALAAYDRAAGRAAEKKDEKGAFEIAYTAAALEQKREHHRAAVDRFGKLARSMPRHPRAAEAHLLAVHSAAQLAQSEQPPKLDEYEKLLREHVATWPSEATASQAWWWLGRLLETRQSWTQAIHALRNVDSQHPQYAAAVEATGRCYEGLLAKSRDGGNGNVPAARDAVRYFEQVIAPGGKSPPVWSPAARAAALAAARISLHAVPGGAARAEQLLTAALEGSADAPAEWKARVRGLLVPAMGAEGHVADAEAQLQQIPIGVDDSLTLIDTLAELARGAPPERRKQLGALELTAIADLLARRDELDGPTLQAVTRRQAATLAAAGRRSEALTVLESLAAANPRDGQSQEDLAALLMTGDDASLKAALAKWREVADKSRPGSPRWFRAHYATARVQLDLGNVSQARSTVRLVESSYPDLGGAEMKPKFQQLLAECQRPPIPRGKQK